MDNQRFNHDLLAFLQQSPTPFHATRNLAAQLQAAGFLGLNESDTWKLEPGKSYYVSRNDSSIIAFRLGSADPLQHGVRMVGAHTDSPCLKVKPNPEMVNSGCFQLGVEVYGGALLNPWFDRDLSLAGRITYRSRDQRIRSLLIDYGKPIACIPSLAIHLDREVNQSRCINAQQHLPPILFQVDEGAKPDFRSLLLEYIHQQFTDSDADRVLDYELSLYDTQPPALLGLDNEFIVSARLDNLLSCYTGLQGLLQATGEQTCLLVCNDHEEVGSTSSCGANGPFLQSVMERICGHREALTRTLDRSLFISADNAHAIHPNYADRHDANHGPQLNQGPVIKVNANQRYATNSETSALFRHFAQQCQVPVQSFVIRTDMACGSTIGPITAGELGVKTLDIGVPQLAMHSIRELAGARDAYYLYQILLEFFRAPEITC